MLGYTQWRNFEQVMAKAREACRNEGQEVDDHFADVSKLVDLGSEARRDLEDMALTRYAAYLFAQPGKRQEGHELSVRVLGVAIATVLASRS